MQLALLRAAGKFLMYMSLVTNGAGMCRAQKAGATVADELDPGVTHVIADKNTSAQQASAKLQASDMHSPVLVGHYL